MVIARSVTSAAAAFASSVGEGASPPRVANVVAMLVAIVVAIVDAIVGAIVVAIVVAIVSVLQ